ncbi:MAG: hypothetical protein RRY21_06780, partial [Oscillospiraceae bacterium]
MKSSARIEGYHEDRKAAGFFGCDRLLKLDSLFGTIQLGYDPRKGQSFLFANIKTSIFDTAASREQREMSERDQMRELKTGNQNRAFVARRRQNSSVVLFKAENKPWGEGSVAPYLGRVNTGALRKTLPFLEVREQQTQRMQAAQQQQALQQDEHKAQQRPRDFRELRDIRAQRVALSREQDQLGALIVRKQQRSLWFFRRINLVFDLQKQKMFAHYRNRMAERRLEAENA